MGLFSSLFESASLDRGPGSDFWYEPVGSMAKSGEVVTQDSLLRIAAVIQGVRFVCQTIGMLPRFVYKRRENRRGRDKDFDHNLNHLLRFKPNAWQTAMQFTEQITAFAMLRGIGLAEVKLIGGELALWPVQPDVIAKIEQIRETGRLRFHLRNSDGTTRPLGQDDVFWVSGFGVGGVKGLELVDRMRDTAGLALATETYGSTFFSNSAMPRVVLTAPNYMDQETRDRMKHDWRNSYSRAGQHGTALLEGGTTINTLSTSNDEAQFIDTKKFIIGEFSRYLDVSPHRLSDLERASFNNIEEMSLETVIYTLTPWVTRWEQSIYRDLLTPQEQREQRTFVEFALNGLLRGDAKARSEFYASAIQHGHLTRNEVREFENLNPIDGLDEPLQPVNMETAAQAEARAAQVQSGGGQGSGGGDGQGGRDDDDQDDDDRDDRDRNNTNTNRRRPRDRDGDGRIETESPLPVLVSAAQNLARVERDAVAAIRANADSSGKLDTEAIRTYYLGHCELIINDLAMPRERAVRWCSERERAVRNGNDLPYQLVALSLAAEAIRG